MSKSMLVGAALGVVGATAGGAIATYSLVDHGPDYAEVVAVQPVKRIIRMSCQVCKNVAVTRQRPVKDQHRIAGVAVSVVVDDLLDSQIGGGTGREIVTVTGTVGGGYAGNKVQEGMQEYGAYTTTETHCGTVHDSSEEVVDYDIRYVLDGKAGQIRIERDPGSRIPVDKNGQLTFNQGEMLR